MFPRRLLSRGHAFVATAGFCSMLIADPAAAQLRVVSYNVAGLEGSASALSDVFGALMADDRDGYAVAPHVIVMQETDVTDVGTILAMLNAEAPVGVAYVTATYTNSGENAGAQACFYRTDTLAEDGTAHDDISTGAGRNADRWRFEMVGYDNEDASFYVYSAHLKASPGSANEADRLSGVQALRANAATLPADAHVIFCGDFNFYSNGEDGYLEFLAAGSAQAFDPLGTDPWGGGANALKHTQSPRVIEGNLIGGGMDDRFDFILPSIEFDSVTGLEMMPNTYRSVGNDGSHFDQAINAGNNFYFPGDVARSNALADDLHDASDHIPVMVEFRRPALLGATMDPVAGRVIQNGAVLWPVSIQNAADVVTASGATNLPWIASASGALLGGSSGTELPLATPTTAFFPVNTASTGPFAGTVTIDAFGEGIGNVPLDLDLTGTVVRAADPSFEALETVTEREVDWSVTANTGVQTTQVLIFNHAWDANQALLDVDDVVLLNGAATFETGLASNIGGGVAVLTFAFDTDGAAPGVTTAEFDLVTSDEDIPGEGQHILGLSFSIDVTGDAPIPGDTDGDGDVDFTDLVALLSAWGPCPEPPAECVGDFNDDGEVSFTDLVTLLSNWG